MKDHLKFTCWPIQLQTWSSDMFDSNLVEAEYFFNFPVYCKVMKILETVHLVIFFNLRIPERFHISVTRFFSG